MKKNVCPNCGFNNDADSVFCTNCGASLNISNDGGYDTKPVDYGYDKNPYDKMIADKNFDQKVLKSGNIFSNKVLTIIASGIGLIIGLLFLIYSLINLGLDFFYYLKLGIGGTLMIVSIASLILAIVNIKTPANVLVGVEGLLLYVYEFAILALEVFDLDKQGQSYSLYILFGLLEVFLIICLVCGIFFIKSTSIPMNISFSVFAILGLVSEIVSISSMKFTMVKLSIYALYIVFGIIATIALAFYPRYDLSEKFYKEMVFQNQLQRLSYDKEESSLGKENSKTNYITTKIKKPRDTTSQKIINGYTTTNIPIDDKVARKDAIEKLSELKKMLDDGVISKDEFEEKKKDYFKKL